MQQVLFSGGGFNNTVVFKLNHPHRRPNNAVVQETVDKFLENPEKKFRDSLRNKCFVGFGQFTSWAPAGSPSHDLTA